LKQQPDCAKQQPVRGTYFQETPQSAHEAVEWNTAQQSGYSILEEEYPLLLLWICESEMLRRYHRSQAKERATDFFPTGLTSTYDAAYMEGEQRHLT
jgi:hypothetical protein